MTLTDAEMNRLPVVFKKPCTECPWRRCHPAGWLGGYLPEHFVASVHHSIPIPCHKTLEEGRKPALCAGALIFMKNSCKLPDTQQLVNAKNQVEADREKVFMFPQEFLDHHNSPEAWLSKVKAQSAVDCTES